jgi:hypothetical protein
LDKISEHGLSRQLAGDSRQGEILLQDSFGHESDALSQFGYDLA